MPSPTELQGYLDNMKAFREVDPETFNEGIDVAMFELAMFVNESIEFFPTCTLEDALMAMFRATDIDEDLCEAEKIIAKTFLVGGYYKLLIDQKNVSHHGK